MKLTPEDLKRIVQEVTERKKNSSRWRVSWMARNLDVSRETVARAYYLSYHNPDVWKLCIEGKLSLRSAWYGCRNGEISKNGLTRHYTTML